MTDDAVATNQIDLNDLAAIVTGMTRFITRLSKMAPFEEAGLGLAEWSALSVIANRHGANNRQLAALLGVTAQRVNQITDSLSAAKYITRVQAADDARKKIIAITQLGSDQLDALNRKLQPIVRAGLGNRPKSLTRANRMVNGTLMRIVVPSRLRLKR